MSIINKLEIVAVFTMLSLTLGNQPVFSRNNALNQLESVKTQELKTAIVESGNTNTLLISSRKLVNVNDSLTIMPIPQPLAILCLLGMGGISSFLKLKIAQAKYQKQSRESIEKPSFQGQLPQILHR